MASYVATSDVKWGSGETDDNGLAVVKVFHDGEVVTGPSEEEFAQLLEAGAVVPKSAYRKRLSPEEEAAEQEAAAQLRDRNKELEDELAQLRAKLAAADNKSSTEPKTSTTPPAS